MRTLRFVCLLLILVVAACSDPVTDVGLDLLEDEISATVRLAPVLSLSESSRTDITGSTPRVLVGAVDDPLTGQIFANGFMDFEGTFGGAPSETINEARLIFSRNYQYGDTLTPVQIGLHQILAEWNDTGLESDTELNIGPEIFTVTISDLRSSINLPESWVRDNEDLLKSDDFESKFHGFALIQHESRHVIGLNAATSFLEVITSATTDRYQVSSTLTQVKRMSPAQTPSGYVLFQDGAGPFIDFTVNLESFENQPINGAIIRFHALTDQSTPEHFVRPTPDSLSLFAVPTDDAVLPFPVGVAQRNEGEYRFSGSLVNVFIQSILFGTQEVKHLELRAPRQINSLSAVLLYDLDGQELAPSLTMILPP